MKKLTNKHFDLYKKYCNEYIDAFGLRNYYVSYEFEDNKETDWLASFSGDLKAMQMCLSLARNWDDEEKPTPKELKRIALHEVLHAVLHRLKTNGEYRYVNEEEIGESEHSVIQCLMNFINKHGQKGKRSV